MKHNFVWFYFFIPFSISWISIASPENSFIRRGTVSVRWADELMVGNNNQRLKIGSFFLSISIYLKGHKEAFLINFI